MNDHERFSKQMTQTFDLLERILQDIDLPTVEKDKIAGLIRQLREYAYKAGRTELSTHSIPRQDPVGLGDAPRIRAKPILRCHKGVDDSIKIEPQVSDLLRDGLMTDESWQNNTLAHFERVLADGKILILWIAEEHPKEREYESVPRYTVQIAGLEGVVNADAIDLLSTEDTDEVVKFVRLRIAVDQAMRQMLTDKIQ